MFQCVLSAVLLLPLAGPRLDDAEELLKKVWAAFEKGDAKTALKLTSQALETVPKRADVWLFRGAINEDLRDFTAAVADYSKALELDPKIDEAFNHRGSAHFKLGQFALSLADFDAYLEKHPDKVPHHWQRGISYYYAGRLDDGRKQFEGYESVDSNDVENAVWQCLCVARKDGIEKARAGLLKVQNDTRIPMMEVYGLFAGKLKPDAVLAAAKKAKTPEALNRQIFYAHFYIGLYFEAIGDAPKALEQMELAVQHRVGHYMWEVARVHRDVLKKS
jgi:lipoprotein NlpI